MNITTTIPGYQITITNPWGFAAGVFTGLLICYIIKYLLENF